MSYRTYFLKFQNLHLSPINGIDPDSIKKSAKETRETFLGNEKASEFKHTTALNHICKSLGFKGGFSGYKKEWESNLKPFMKRHGLLERSEVIEEELQDKFVELKAREIADRLFCPGQKIPKKIFVGADYFDLLKVVAECGFGDVAIARGNLQFARVSLDQVSEYIPPNNYFVVGEEARFRWEDIFNCLDNLIGDQLLDFGSETNRANIVAQLYNTSAAEMQEIEAAGALFAKCIRLLESGWIDVIPYNENLVFLRAKNGKYDFVFKDMRDEEFQSNPYKPYLRSKDISSNGEENQFREWLYFKYDGWLAEDTHKAEHTFYDKGGVVSGYPSQMKILEDYFVCEKRYQPIVKRYRHMSGFHPVSLGSKSIYFSDLITVGQFKKFLKRNPDYVWHRKKQSNLDSLSVLENEKDNYPASVTWYDAMAYARWVKREKRAPVRLLSEEEWLSLADRLGQRTVNQKVVSEALGCRLASFYDPSGEKFEGHPPYSDDFDAWELRYEEDAFFKQQAETGFEVVCSAFFGEWLNMQGAAINSLFGCSQYCVWEAALNIVSANRARFAPTSTGKYKSTKIGFRVAYDAEAVA